MSRAGWTNWSASWCASRTRWATPWPMCWGWILSAETLEALAADAAAAAAAPIHARWYDGRSSQAQAVRVRLQRSAQGPDLQLAPAPPQPQLTVPNRQIGWPETWGSGPAPRTLTVDLGPHGSLEIDDAAAWQEALRRAGQRLPLAQRMQTRWPAFLGVLVLAACGLWAFYAFGTPWAAAQLSAHVPLAWETELSERALQDMDQSVLKPSQLPPERQAQLQARFDALTAQVQPALQRYRGYAPRLVLAFRAGLGANAFALPGGTIVMTDGMVAAAAKAGLNDDALVGVLAHEIGHVLHRHTTRMVVEQGVLNIGLGLALGDVSVLVSAGSSLLTGLAYRRSHEAEADCFAIGLMRQAKLPTAPMADLLLGLEAGRSSKAAPAEPAASRSSIASLLSSHPQTAERAAKLKKGIFDGC
ncbi:MAG: M48 family metallopeptidase [Burkholderiaceae bacterium]